MAHVREQEQKAVRVSASRKQVDIVHPELTQHISLIIHKKKVNPPKMLNTWPLCGLMEWPTNFHIELDYKCTSASSRLREIKQMCFGLAGKGVTLVRILG